MNAIHLRKMLIYQNKKNRFYLPDSATGSVCLKIDGGGGGSRTRE
jgi:hypothetical protein